MPTTMRLDPGAERIAEAGQVLKMYGDGAPRFIAARIGALAVDGDAAGVRRWIEIAGHVSALMGLKAVH